MGFLFVMFLVTGCSNQDEPTFLCNNCGEEVLASSNFCQSCGLPVQEIEHNDSESDSDVQEYEEEILPEDLNELSTMSATIEYGFLDYTEFSTYWFDGIFRCGTDFEAGEYYILPLFGAGAAYEVCDSPNDFSWSHERLLRKIAIQSGQYVNVGHGAIMVPANEVDTEAWSKYGVFLVGKDLPAGDYKMESISDTYASDLYGITGIQGAYQLNSGDLNSTPVDSGYLFESQSYISLENGQYIVITNTKLTNVEAE